MQYDLLMTVQCFLTNQCEYDAKVVDNFLYAPTMSVTEATEKPNGCRLSFHGEVLEVSKL